MAGKSSKSETELVDAVAAAQLGNGPLPGGEVVGVDKIRDLLFGNQMQDYDRRFTKLEERFLQRFKDIESETARNLSAFELNAKKQVGSLVGLRTPIPHRRHQSCRFSKGASNYVRLTGMSCLQTQVNLGRAAQCLMPRSCKRISLSMRCVSPKLRYVRQLRDHEEKKGS